MSNDSDESTPTSSTASNVEDALTSQTWTAAEFIRLFREEDLGDRKGWRVLGDVNLTAEKFEGLLQIRGLMFTGLVNLSQCRFERKADFTGCHFQKGLILTDARVEGSLILDDVVIGAQKAPLPNLAMVRRIVARLKAGRRRMRSDRSEPPQKRICKIKRRLRRRSSQHRCQKRLREAEAHRPQLQIVAELTNLRVAGCLSMLNARIFGHLFCNHADIEDDLRIDQSWIYGDLMLRRTNLGELRTDGQMLFSRAEATEPCRIDGGLDLTSAEIDGDVRLIGAILGGELTLQATDIDGNLLCRANRHVRTRLKNGAWLLGVRVRGTIDFGGTRLYGELTFATGSVGGRFECAQAGKWYFTMNGNADLSNSRIGAYANFALSRLRGNVSLAGTKIESDMFFTGADIEKNINVQNASIDGTLFCTAAIYLVHNIPCRIGGQAWLLSATIQGDADFSGAHIGGDLIMQNAKISQNLLARVMGGLPTQIKGRALLNGIRIAGAAEFEGAELQSELNLDGASIDNGLMVSFDLTDTPAWGVVRSHVAQGIRAEFATFGRRVALWGLDVGQPNHEAGSSTTGSCGVSFVGARINGEFSLYSAQAGKDNLQAKEAGAAFKGISPAEKEGLFAQARRELTRIQGSLRLTRAQVLSGIVLDGVTIGGDLDLQDAEVRANIACRRIRFDSSGESVRASVHQADLETLETTGDIDLTGLTVDRDLILRDARIRGRLELYPFSRKSGEEERGAKSGTDHPGKTNQKGPACNLTKIDGALHMDSAEITHVIVSGKSFGERPQEAKRLWEKIRDTISAAWQQGDYLLIMFFLRGGHLEEDKSFERPEKSIVLEHATIERLDIFKPLPGTLYLSSLKVGSWWPRPAKEWPRPASFFQQMLELARPFRKSSYVAIENDLRNKGRDEEADEIHVWMRRRDRRNTRALGRVIWDRLLDLSTKYGTTSARLFWVLVLSFLVTVWFFSNPAHVEYDIVQTADQPSPIVKHPEPRAWRIADAAFLAVRLHVPIVSLGLEGEVKPSGRKMKAYAMAVTAASWAIWPLLIASLSGFLRKRS